MNKTLADVARKGLKDPRFPSRHGLCQAWVRTAIETCYGDTRYTSPRPASAKDAAHQLMARGVAHLYKKGEPLEIGDVLYKTIGSGGFGHVGVYLGGGTVAENSSFHARTDSDARGIRTLKQFGAFQVLARLPDPKATKPGAIIAAAVTPKPTEPPMLVLNSKLAGPVLLQDGKLWVQARAVLEASGHKLTGINDSIASKGRFYINAERIK